MAHDQLGVGCRDSLDIAITLAAAARAQRDAMRDKSYQRTPIGEWVRRYIRWKRNEWGATPATIRDYEAILARMAISLADRQPIDVDAEDLRDVIELWAMKSARTRAKVTSVIRDFWGWAEEQGLIALSPAARIRRPRVERRVARVLPRDARSRLLSVAGAPRDRLGLFCLLGLGLRRDELGALQARDFDAHTGAVIVYGKGQKERRLPVRGAMLAELRLYFAADLPHVGRPPEPDDHLIYPVFRRLSGRREEGQANVIYRAEPKRKCSPQAVHRWWYRIAADAGLVAHGQTAGLNMHRARHLFALEVRRVAGIDAASQALGHSNLSTTLGIYGHRDEADLEHAMDLYADWLREEGL